MHLYRTGVYVVEGLHPGFAFTEQRVPDTPNSAIVAPNCSTGV